MNKHTALFLLFVFFSMMSCLQRKTQNNHVDQINAIDEFLTTWHEAAANANFESYFEKMDDDFVFLGTDANEYWTKSDFAKYSKPYFDKGKAWEFIKLKRNIYMDNSEKVAWFDETLETSFKICRGSGVLQKDSTNCWRIKQYVLSMTIPNEKSSQIVSIKDSLETILIKKLKK
jgi:hypothetical protein